MRQLARSQRTAAEVLEYENISEAWQAVLADREKEDTERRAHEAEGTAGEEDEDVEKALTLRRHPCLMDLRKPPTSFPEKSQLYWRSVANMTVRQHTEFIAEGETQTHVTTSIAQSAVNKATVEEGKSVLMIWLDLDCVGEGCGPHGQPRLRRRPNYNISILRKLLHGVLLARGGKKKSEDGEATTPAPCDIVAIHEGAKSISTRKDMRSLFRLRCARSDSIDAFEKSLLVVYKEESVRTRKRRVRGSEAYSCASPLHMYSPATLIPDMLAEAQRQEYEGFNTGDVIGRVRALQPNDLWLTTRMGGEGENRGRGRGRLREREGEE